MAKLTFEVGKKYIDLDNNIITITGIRKNTIVVGTEEYMITYSQPRYDGKIVDGWNMLENSVYAQSLTLIEENITSEESEPIQPKTQTMTYTQWIDDIFTEDHICKGMSIPEVSDIIQDSTLSQRIKWLSRQGYDVSLDEYNLQMS